MNFLNTIFSMHKTFLSIKILFVYLFLFPPILNAQLNRIEYNNRNLFLNGSNVAWVRFAGDIGPGFTDFARFGEFFAELKAAGGNSFRLWLHTDGTTTPEFDGNGLVVSPGVGAIDDLKQILDSAWAHEVGLMLCLWSHDMMATSKSSTVLDRNEKLLTDTSAIRVYIDNALIPMVEALEGHPGILAWEIFNEPEGFTEIGNWGDRRHVTQFDVQRFVNLTAGAIHRADTSVQVTNGTWGMQAQTDVYTLNKFSPEAFLNSLSEEEKNHMEEIVKSKYGIDLSAEGIINKFYKPNAQNTNYYSDEELIKAGGDPDGILDFYTVHYYSWAGTALSPFHNPYSFWELDKPLAIAEFFMENAFGVPYQNLYNVLYNTGYAGALSWQWLGDTQANDNAKNNDHSRTVAAMLDIFHNHANDVVVNPKPGEIYSFRTLNDTINLGKSATLKWITAIGSTPELDGVSVDEEDSLVINPELTTTYTLITNNEVAETSYVKVEVLLPGTILSFSVFPYIIASGEEVNLKWKTSDNSQVKLNGNPVSKDDSVFANVEETTIFKLTAEGMNTDTAEVVVNVLPVDQVNRALERTVTVSSGSDPNNIVDGKFNTLWNSENAQSQWVHIELGSFHAVNRIVLKWGNNYAKSYRIAKYNHPIFYSVIIEKTNAETGGIHDYTNLNDTLRNLRVLLDESSSFGYSLREVEVYGIKILTEIDDYFFVNDYKLEQNYPNPFNPTTGIGFTLPESGFVSLTVYDVLGKKVADIVNEELNPGIYHYDFNASNLASGMYLYTLKSGNFRMTKKMILLK